MTLTPIALTTLFVSSLMVISSNSWVLLWVCLEMNTLAFCSMLTSMESKKSKKTSEAAMKYFIIQSTASAIMVLYLATPSQISGSKLLFLSGTAAILMKLASAPFHSWFLEIVPKLTLKSNTILMTWQKLAPVFILTYMLKTVILLSIIMSGLLGSIMQLNKSSLLEILALSSVFNLSWMMLAALTSNQCLFLFILTYWAILVATLATFKKAKILSNSDHAINTTSPWTLMMLMAGLAGIPPSLGFYAKIQVALSGLKESLSSTVTVLMVISAMNFYIYLRMVTPSVTISPSQRQKNKEKGEKLMMLVIFMNLLPMLALTM